MNTDYEANRDDIAAGRLCASCGEHMRHPDPSGLCGFCLAEQQEVAA